MNTLDLNKTLRGNPVTKRFFLGTFPACITPETNKKFYTFITNTENHDESGEHWNAWVVDNDNTMFFDSYGQSPHMLNYHDIVKKFNQVKYTTNRLQDFGSRT